MTEEIWKPIILENEKTDYEVSNKGRVKRLARVTIVWNRYQFTNRHLKEMIMTLCNDSDGYKILTILNKTRRVHRLVAQAFIPNPENKGFVNHINSIRDDNNVNNLEWCTPKENNDHLIENNRQVVSVGVRNKASKHSEDFILKIKKLLDEGYNATEISKMLNTERYLVTRVRDGISWSHLTGVRYRGKNKRRLNNNPNAILN